MQVTGAFAVAGHKVNGAGMPDSRQGLGLSGPGVSAPPCGLGSGERSLYHGPAPSSEFEVAGLVTLCWVVSCLR